MTNQEYRKFRELSENKAFKDVFKEFKRISKDIDLDGINEDNVEERVDQSLKNNNIDKVLFAVWLLIGVSYVKSTFKLFALWERQQGLPIPKNRLKDFKATLASKIDKKELAVKVESIVNTYKETVIKAIEIDKSIIARDFYAGESQRIAITETTFATNKANDLAGDFTEIKVLKQWITFVDGKERPWHRDVNLVTVPKDGLFTVNGEKMLFPGDGTNGATGENLIACRCRFGYRRDRNN